jgi:NTP pyrophosphatase (non-canonical NTP hydrolase)
MVNITDISEDKIPEGDMLEEMFKRQGELLEKYHPIEQAAGFHTKVWTDTFSLDDKYDQYLLKDFAWRVTEELGEAALAYKEKGNSPHTQEEMADALHFLIELNLWAGVDHVLFYNSICQGATKPDSCSRLEFCFRMSAGQSLVEVTFRDVLFLVVEYLAEAMNTLKQKPWKQTHMLTDKQVFHKALKNANMAFLIACAHLHMTPGDLSNMYFKKSEVNKFRIGSKY